MSLEILGLSAGEKVRFRAKGILARVLQHEIDHLDGVLFFDRMESVGLLFYPQEVEAGAEESEEAVTA